MNFNNVNKPSADLKKTVKFIALALLLPGYSLNGQSIDLTGVWCGKWDNIYATCFEVTHREKSFHVTYRWEEKINRGLQTQSLIGRQLNINTLDMSGKILIVDLKDHRKALAIGIFDNHSRIAHMTKQNVLEQ